ncbi:polar amino acid transport system substrate-binding protein [Bradyrhizobium sp. USDA 4509]
MLSRTGLHLAISMFAIAFCADADPTHAATKTIINALTTPVTPPTEYKDPETGKLMGFDIDLFEAMAAKMGAKVNWIESAWEQIIPSLKTKRGDVIVASMFQSPERQAVVDFLDYLNDGVTVIALRANAARFPNMDALCGQRVAVGPASNPRGSSELKKWSDEHCTKAGKPMAIGVETTGTADSRLQLNQGRVDAALQATNTVGYQSVIENNAYVVVGKPLYSGPLGIAFSKDDTQFGQELKKALAALIADGTYQKLMRKWNLPDISAIEQATINDGQP